MDGSADDLPEFEPLRAAVLRNCPPRRAPQEASSVEPWAPRVEALLDKGLGAKAIYDRLKLEHEDFTGSYWAVKRMCLRLRGTKPIAAEDIAIQVATGPGEIAQVDFGEVGKLYDAECGELRRAWVFVMVLGYSRHMFAKVVFDQTTRTWLHLHAEAFRALGGVPKSSCRTT